MTLDQYEKFIIAQCLWRPHVDSMKLFAWHAWRMGFAYRQNSILRTK